MSVEQRMNIAQIAPEAYRHLLQMERLIADKLDRKLIHLIKLRASQINGCAYCIVMHTEEALADGETPHRLTLLDVTPTFTVHPKTGERFYRNNLHTNITYDRAGLSEMVAELRAKQKRPSGMFLDNGEKLSEAEAETIIRTFEEIELAWPWQNGDIMMLDNLQVAHGRNTFTGPREIMVALLDY